MMQDAENQCGGQESAGQGLADAGSNNMKAAAVHRFMTGFKGLCRSEDDLARLGVLAEKICGRWGYHGCDMVAALHGQGMGACIQYHNLDLDRLEKAADTYVQTSENDFQLASEQFWWLMGVGGYGELLHDQLRFDDFRELMEREGIMACKKRASEIRRRINAVTGQPE